MCVEYNCWKLSPAFRKIIKLEKTLYECFSWFFPGSGSLRDHHRDMDPDGKLAELALGQYFYGQDNKVRYWERTVNRLGGGYK